MQIKYTHAFSLLEILLSLTLLSILSIVMLKPYTTNSLALRQANLHIQTLQEINKQAYYAFLKKSL